MIYAIILAAGKGTRMKTETPKCAFSILKKPMINYVLDNVNRSLVEKNIVVVGHKKEELLDLITDSEIAFQEEQLGTGDAVKKAIPYLEEGISVILPGDAPLINEKIINKLINNHHSSLTIGTTILDNPYGYGRIIRADGKIIKIIEEKDASIKEKEIKEVNTGLMVVNNKDLKEALEKITNNNAKHEYYLTDIVELIKDKDTCLIEEKEELTGINDLYTLSLVEKYIQEKKKKELMLDGVNMINPETSTIGIDVKINEGAIIYPGCFITGKTVIGKNAIIGPNSELHNAIIEDNATCKHSVVYDSTICTGASVGPFSHLRMNAVVGKNDRIGNFVEIKKSTLGEKTNAAHLSYIGDSIIGSRVNVGCGSITVNYDGKNKHQTIIGNDVFIGCNSNLIAPITIGDHAFIAAGSTINKDVPASALAIARNHQTNKEEYAAKYKK